MQFSFDPGTFQCDVFHVGVDLRTALKVRASLWKRHRLIGVLGKAGGPSQLEVVSGIGGSKIRSHHGTILRLGAYEF